jgi:shikimate kinase
MGCGKSSVGRRLCGLTGHRFLDIDELIAQKEGRSISEIFMRSGEDYFRDAEQLALENLVGVWGIVLSTGGGLVLRQSNCETLKKIGIIAWLDASPDVLFERATRSGKRPLLQTDNPRKRFDDLLSVRRELYRSTADFRIDSTRLTHDEAAQMLLEKALRRHRRFES